MNNIVDYIINPDIRFRALSSRGFYNSLSDEEFLHRKFHAKLGYKLDLNNPKTFNEKLQWLKLHDRNPIYTTMVDKYAVKEYIASIIGEQYIIPTLGVWNRFDDIDFDSLPNQFVLKCSHDSGGLVIVKDKRKMDLKLTKKKISKSLKRNYYYIGREWPYKNVKPRIIAEKFIDNNSLEGDELTDYKFYCFGGNAECVMTCYERSSGDPKFYFFDKDWQLLRINKRGKHAPIDFSKPCPECLDEMFMIASVLSKGMAFVRIDLYQSNGKVFFGESTFYPQSGFDPNYLPETDRYFGALIDLSLAYDNNSPLQKSESR